MSDELNRQLEDLAYGIQQAVLNLKQLTTNVTVTGLTLASVNDVALRNLRIGAISAAKALNDIAKASGRGSKAIDNLSDSFEDVGDTAKELTDSLTDVVATTDLLKEAEEHLRKQIAEHVKHQQLLNALLKDFTDTLKQSLIAIGKGLFDVKFTLTDFGKSVKNTTESLGRYVEAFGGPVAKIGAFLIKMVGTLVASSLELTDNQLKGADSLAQLGVNTGITTEEMAKTARAAGFLAADMEKYGDVFRGVGNNIRLFGSNATEGFKLLGGITASTPRLIANYKAMGISTEKLLKLQLDAAVVQSTVTGALKNSRLTQEQLNVRSKDYVNNLIALRDLTGMDIEDMQKRRDEVLKQIEIDTRITALQVEAADLMERANAASGEERQNLLKEAAAKERDAQAAHDVALSLGAMGMSAKQISGIIEGIATDSTSQSELIALMGDRFSESIRKFRETGDSFVLFDAAISSTRERLLQFGSKTFGFMDTGIAQSIGLTNELNKALREGKISREEYDKMLDKIKNNAASNADSDKRIRAEREANQIAAAKKLEEGMRPIQDLVMGAVDLFNKAIRMLGRTVVRFGQWIGKRFDLDGLKNLDEREFMTNEEIKARVIEDEKRIAEIKKQLGAKYRTEDEIRADVSALEEKRIRGTIKTNEYDTEIKRLEKELREMNKALYRNSDITNELSEIEKRNAEDKKRLSGNRASEDPASRQNAESAASKPTVAPASSKDFYNQIYGHILDEAKKQGVKNPEVIARLGAVQSALETEYGSALAGGNNYFGIKARPGDPGGGSVSAKEWDPNTGQLVTTQANFRKYGSMRESAADYVKFLLENSRYKGVLAATTAEDAITAQGMSGYATDPKYGKKLLDIHQSMTGGAKGGLFSTGGISAGSSYGYQSPFNPNMKLHRTELVKPLRMGSLLDEWSQTDATEAKREFAKHLIEESGTQVATTDSGMMYLGQVFKDGLREIVDQLSSSRDVQQQIVYNTY